MKLDAPKAPAALLIVCLSFLTANAADSDTFTPIFDGKNLDGWRVIPADQQTAWSVRDGLLVGNSDGTGSDLIWKADDLADFELKLSYRFRTEGNSGVHIRGLLGELSTHRVKGYHADFGHVGIGPRVLGSWDFHGAPRGSYLVERGRRVVIDEHGKKYFTMIEGALTSGDDVRRRRGRRQRRRAAHRAGRLRATTSRRAAHDHRVPRHPSQALGAIDRAPFRPVAW